MPISSVGDASLATVSPAMVQLTQQVCTASRHSSDRAEVVGAVTGSGISPMSEWVDKYQLICCVAHTQYFDAKLDNYCLFTLNNTGLSYMLILSVLV